MPATPRRSSQGAGRRNDKANQPYRGDQMAVGKRTGIVIREVERHSDGFENFEDIMDQDDPRTPPRAKRRGRKTPLKAAEVEEYDDGDMSMDLVDSPLQYIQPAAKAISASKRVGSTSRPVARTPPIDFDQVPSPRNGSNRKMNTPIRSRLSQSIAAGTFLDDEADLDEGPDVGFDNYSGEFDQDSPPHRSFQEMDEDEEDEEPMQEQVDMLPPDLSRSSSKGKGKAQHVDEVEDEVEDELAGGFDDMGAQSEEQMEATPRPAKRKKEQESKVVRKIIRPLQKENRNVPDGVRRSQRHHMPPLDWWRNEKVVYGRTGDDHILVPQIKEIQRVKASTPPPLGKKPGRKRKRLSQVVEVIKTSNPEEGWDKDTNPIAEILTWPDGEGTEERQIAFTAKMIHPSRSGNNEWFHQRLFGDGQFMAAGHLIIPKHTRKQTKRSRDNTFVFYLIEGAVNLRINKSSLMLCSGSAFIVPRGNAYYIENIAERDAKLFFTQARPEKMPPQQNRRSSGRSSSTGRTVVESSDGPTLLRRAASSRI